MHNEKLQIELFIQPVLLVDQNQHLIASNSAFDEHLLLRASLDDLLQKLSSLINGERDRLLYVNQDQEFVLTSLPIQSNRWLIRCDSAKSSALATRYQNILAATDQVSDAVIICDVYANIDIVNEKFQTLFPNISQRHLEGKPVIDFVTQVLNYILPDQPKKAAVLSRFIRKILVLKQPCKFGFTINGRYLEYRDRISYSGERIGLLIDETTHKELNDQLQIAYDEASKLSLAKSDFMAAMSHEVRTPLNAIIGILELCEYDEKLAGNEYISRLKYSADNLLRLINDVLDFTKFDAEMADLAPVTVDIRRLCEQRIEDFIGQAQLKNTTMSLFVDPRIPRLILVDDVRVIQVLSNLISNALKFNICEFPDITITVDRSIKTDLIRFHIKDNGIGISKAQQKVIFTGFSQASPGIHREFGGTGLGLSICQKICTLMGGKLYIESEPGMGTMFTFEFPLIAQSAAELDFLKTEVFQQTTVLTDDPRFYKILRQYSNFLGFKCELIVEIPDSLELDQMLIVSSSSISEIMHHDRPEHVAILFDNTPLKEFSNFYPMQKVPLKLSSLESFICAQRTSPTFREKEKIKPTINKKLRALVVEDNKDNMFVLRKQFSSLGIEASFAMGAEDAVIYFEQQPFDIVLSDYQMPAVSGSELLAMLVEIEEREDKPRATKLILTADKTQACYENCMQAGADQVIYKPLTLSQLSIIFSCTVITKSSENIEDHTHINTNLDIENDEAFFFGESQVITKIPGAVIEQFAPESIYSYIGDMTSDEVHSFLLEFFQNLNDIRIEMTEFADTKQWKKIQKVAHSLKSSALIVGAQELSSNCENLEELDFDNTKEEQLISSWHEVNTSIERLTYLLQMELSNNET
jgi:signal transduction histidine kinase/HPt (histidine-containing phosphotransfer) domain-containing protein/ActR/RegA family two-component response regulator